MPRKVKTSKNIKNITLSQKLLNKKHFNNYKYIDFKFLLLSINIYNNAFVKYKMNRKLQFNSDYVIATLKSCIKVYFEYHLITK